MLSRLQGYCNGLLRAAVQVLPEQKQKLTQLWQDRKLELQDPDGNSSTDNTWDNFGVTRWRHRPRLSQTATLYYDKYSGGLSDKRSLTAEVKASGRPKKLVTGEIPGFTSPYSSLSNLRDLALS